MKSNAVGFLPVELIHPSPENDRIYRPIDADDPDVQSLAESIKREGLLQPLILSGDGFILSGHRRYAAAKLAGLETLPCQIRHDTSRGDDLDTFIALLTEYNRQRVKTFAEVAREAAIQSDPEESYRLLVEHRRRKSDMTDFEDGALDMGSARQRKTISDAKLPMLNAIIRILNERADFWPLSDRQIHYALLNVRPLKHASKPDSEYENDLKSYKALTDLLTRARLDKSIPWAAIADETRPVKTWRAYPSPGPFIQETLDGLFKGYYRDLMQSQPNQIEIVAEKLTVRSIVEPIAMEYCIPMTTGRGYCSIDPRYKMAQRFRKSGKQKLVVLILSDHDPDGETIAQSFARSMRDDFDVTQVVPVKIAITGKQVKQYKLPRTMEAKTGSSTHAAFAAKHGRFAYELEALPPAELQAILRRAIDEAIDVKAFNREVDAEKADAAKLDGFRRTAKRMLAGIELDRGAE